MKKKNLIFPLMKNNISRSDLNSVINFLKKGNPILTQSKKVKEFEEKWSKWLGVKYSVFVNSGSSANLLSMTIIKHLYGEGEIIVPALTWVSDIASVLQNNLKLKFVDINMNNLCMDEDQLINSINNKTKAVFLTHAQGFNGLNSKILSELKRKKIHLIEDVCESHGAYYKKKKLGSYGFISNFSFYYAHHMSTIEGGMICTNNEKIYQNLRMLRSHGLLRETNNKNYKKSVIKKNKSLNENFIFTLPAYNVRNTEIGAIIGINQLKRLNSNIKKRNINHKIFLKNLDKKIFFTDFDLNGSSNYAFNVVLRRKNKIILNKLMKVMNKNGIEFRRGSAGGGNQLRQPYLREFIKKNEWLKYPVTEHIHFYGFYIGNYPDLHETQILKLCKILNSVS